LVFATTYIDATDVDFTSLFIRVDLCMRNELLLIDSIFGIFVIKSMLVSFDHNFVDIDAVLDITLLTDPCDFGFDQRLLVDRPHFFHLFTHLFFGYLG